MDLGAYAQIETLEHIMKENGIEVPRLRGLRLMKTQKPIPKEQMENESLYHGLFCCEQACCSDFQYDADWCEFSPRTNRTKRRYMTFDSEGNATGIRWDKVHGKKRKLFKYLLKTERKKVYENYAVFNQYCGRDDVLYIHARIGGANWPYYCDKVKNQPWFIERKDDAFDNTYCDIYAKIKPVENASSHSEQYL